MPNKRDNLDNQINWIPASAGMTRKCVSDNLDKQDNPDHLDDLDNLDNPDNPDHPDHLDNLQCTF